MEVASFNFAVEEIKRKLSLADLVENYTSLKKSGKGYIGLCPFHDDKNPSLHVNDEEGLYYCFACQAGGDIFKFHMDHNNVDFKEAVHELASKLNIRIKGSVSEKPDNLSKRSSQLRINERALKFFHNNLLKNVSSQKARDYLASRGIHIGLTKEFQLGFAEDSYDKLLSCFKDEKILLDVPLELGLIKSKDGQKFYDAFRNRIIFPIIDVDGDVIGFGGRVINESDQPKYLNSPESSLYKKRKSFYGLFYSKNYIKKENFAILVEGYMDFLALYSSGVKNVVANLGTSFTVDHASHLKRYTGNVVVLYDGDSSGLKASVRSGEILLQAGINPKIAKMPEGSDPDTVLKAKGIDHITDLIKNAQGVTDYFIDDVYDRFKRKELNRSETAKQLVEFGENIADQISKSDFIYKASSRFGFRENDLYSMMKTRKKHSLPEQKKNNQESVDSHEMTILKICLKYPGMIGLIDEEFVFHYINDDNIKKILIKMICEKFEDTSNLLKSFTEPQINIILSKAMFLSDEVDDLKGKEEKMLDECINRLKLRKLEDQLILQRMEIEKSSSSSDETEALKVYKDLLEQKETILNESYKVKV